MTLLSSKFDVLKGWTPGGDAGIDQTLPPAQAGGVNKTFVAGSFVVLQSSGVVDVPSAPSTTWQPVYLVIEGADFDSVYTGMITCLRGKLTIKTDQVSGSVTVGGPLTVNASGQLVAAGANTRYGYVLADNTSVDGTITAELDI